MKTRIVYVIAAALVVSAGCSSAPSESGDSEVSPISCLPTTVIDGPVNIATTVAPITSIIANIAGGTDASINGIVPEGTNSHTFEPKPSDAATLEQADVIFINGLVLEEPTKELALANLKNGAVICELGSQILPESEYIYDFSFPLEGGKPNPHLWTNPPMAKEYAAVARDLLAALNPTNASIFAATYHDAYAYFAAHYGYTVIGAIQPSSFDEPTPKEIADLISQVRESGVTAVFGSEVFPSPVMEQIGAETGVRYVDVLRDDDLIGEPGGTEHSWLGLMRFNYVTMVEALGGDASALKTVDVSDVVKDNATYPQ
jgi:ABC-type Zn uptake system ZnuABC Zn-binding protein ZnuA